MSKNLHQKKKRNVTREEGRPPSFLAFWAPKLHYSPGGKWISSRGWSSFRMNFHFRDPESNKQSFEMDHWHPGKGINLIYMYTYIPIIDYISIYICYNYNIEYHIYTLCLVQTGRRHGQKVSRWSICAHRENINPFNKAAKKDSWGAPWVESHGSSSPLYFYVFPFAWHGFWWLQNKLYVPPSANSTSTTITTSSSAFATVGFSSSLAK